MAHRLPTTRYQNTAAQPPPGVASHPRPAVEPTKERLAWAEHYSRIVLVNIASGAYHQALATVERASREDPLLKPDPRGLSIGERYELPLAEYLSLRTANYLERSGYHTVGDIVQISARNISDINGMGLEMIKEIDAMFATLAVAWTKRNAGSYLGRRPT